MPERCSRLSADKGCDDRNNVQSMVYGGFERDRETLKYRCPARYSGITCKGIKQCPVGDAVRIRLAEDRRVFTPVARSSYRVAGLLEPAQRGGAGQQPAGGRVCVRASGHPRAGQDAAARHHGDDDHASMALGRIRVGQSEHLRSLVKPA